jgi:hypothetical protein
MHSKLSTALREIMAMIFRGAACATRSNATIQKRVWAIKQSTFLSCLFLRATTARRL